MPELIIPKSFQLEPFFKTEDTITYDEDASFSFFLHQRQGLFLFDIMKASHIKSLQPWNERERYVPKLFSDWTSTEEVIAIHFRNRDRVQARDPMIKQLAHFIEAMFWMNKQPVHSLVTWRSELARLEIKPVNVVERLSFSIEQPDHYHSFIQLKALFVEIEKLFYKQLLLDRKKGM
ncbi:YpoC family protein [Desertibacillus haloalkaliphilus]|uniref:YpoC family protein n=1 Tax=Desertibacillus haloalkaliphilus TaxID=1328930 RepID=UPI001C276F79|nr:GTPase [Desertibacillus haloalkaliphilus]MBU8907290.1 GTPase [Desertibacillus haloalkaliphilus]